VSAQLRAFVTAINQGARTTVRPQAHDNPATQVETAKSAPTATQDVSVQLHAFITAVSQELNKAKNVKINRSPAIDDPTIVRWLAIALYLMTSFNCWRLAGKVQPDDAHTSRERGAWRFIAVLFLGLGINKLFGLDAALTEAGRILAQHRGWYGHRNLVQLVFIAQVMVTCMVAAIALVIWARYTSKSTWFALAGTTLVLSFVLVRTVSFYYVDRFLDQQILGFRWNAVLEMGGIALVLLASQGRQIKLARSTSKSLLGPAPVWIISER
jgi:hypothetical protein